MSKRLLALLTALVLVALVVLPASAAAGIIIPGELSTMATSTTTAQ